MSTFVHKGKKISETVETPVQGILTQADFDALPLEQQNKGLYIIDDGKSGGGGKNGATFTPSVSADGVISWTNDGGLENPESVNIKGPQGEQGIQGPQGPAGITEDIYSTAETRIGTWIDGKPVYRIILSSKTAQSADVPVPLQVSNLNVETVVTLRANTIYGNLTLPTPYVYGADITIGIYYDASNKTIYNIYSLAAHHDLPMYIIFEYTKTTDTATKTVAAPVSTMTYEIPSGHTAMASAASASLEVDVSKNKEVRAHESCN